MGVSTHPSLQLIRSLTHKPTPMLLIRSPGREDDNLSSGAAEPREAPASRPEMKRAAAREADAVADAPTLPVVSAASPTPPPASSASTKAPDIIEIRHAVVREVPPAAAFDEEIDLDRGDAEEELEFLPELTEADRGLAEDVLSRLREARGSSAANPARLKVLHNVADSQISDEQLQQIIQGVWNVITLNKLKNDQVEALISWAKEDDFVGEVEMVLALLQEGEYAGSDR